MNPRVRPKIRFGDLPSDDDSSGESGSGGGASLNPFGSKARVSFKAMGPNSRTSSKSAVRSSEPSRSAPGQLVKMEPSQRGKGVPGEPNKSSLDQGEKRCASCARVEKSKLEGSRTSKLNPAIAEFKPRGSGNQAPFEANPQQNFNPNASIPIFGSSKFFNSNLAAPALEPSNAPPATIPTRLFPRRNQPLAGQNAAINATQAKLQQGQASHSFLPTNIVPQVQRILYKNNKMDKMDNNTNMPTNSQNQAFQPAQQANLQQMQLTQLTSQANLQQTFPSQLVPQFHASGMQQPLGDINHGNGAAFNNSIRGDTMQQQGYYGPQPMPIGAGNRGDGATFGTSFNHHGNMQQQVEYAPQPVPMGMGLQGQSQGQSQSQSLPSAPVSHEQAAMNALQAHLSRVEAEQATSGQFSQAGQYSFQTPVRIGTAKSSTPRMTPSSYRFTPRSDLASADLLSPNNAQVGGMPALTEPRNFAPRNNNARFDMDEQPPRFAIQAPVPMHHTDVQGMSAAPQQYGGSHGVSGPLQQQQVPLHPGAGGDPFSSASTGIEKYGGSISNLIRPTQTSLSHVIEPIQPISTALAMQNHPVPEHIRRLRSKQLNELTATPNGRPTAETALHVDNFPFIEGPRCAQPSQNHGVVKLKNIPFSVRRTEIIAFLGRNSKILNDTDEPVHIIMERVTSKTNDAYVEFMSPQAAIAAVDRHRKTIASGRNARLGDRPVEIELSSQSALMKDLFPLAKGVRWNGAEPVILKDHPTEPWNCFKGFITEEEMVMLVKHVEVPQRSPFSKDCPQRPFESMISTLRKFPWYMTDRITVRQRHAVFEACLNLVRCLQWAVREKRHETVLTTQLYRRLWTSAMLCHGFTITMKDSIAFTVDLPENRILDFNMPRFGHMWNHIYTLVPKPGSPLDVIEWYIAIIREETHRTVSLSLPNIQTEIHKEGMQTCLYWGYIFKEMPLPRGEAFDNMTLAEMAAREFTIVTNILQRALSQ